MTKTPEGFGILKIGVICIFETQRAVERPYGSSTQQAPLLAEQISTRLKTFQVKRKNEVTKRNNANITQKLVTKNNIKEKQKNTECEKNIYLQRGW